MQTRTEKSNRAWRLSLEAALLASSVVCVAIFVGGTLGHHSPLLYSALVTTAALSIFYAVWLLIAHGWQRSLITIAIGTIATGILDIIIQGRLGFINSGDWLSLLLIGGIPLGNVLNYLAHLRK